MERVWKRERESCTYNGKDGYIVTEWFMLGDSWIFAGKHFELKDEV